MRNLALITCVSLLASTSSYAVTLNSLFDVNPETARYCKEATVKGIFGEARIVYECPNVVPDQKSGLRDPLTTGSLGTTNSTATGSAAGRESSGEVVGAGSLNNVGPVNGPAIPGSIQLGAVGAPSAAATGGGGTSPGPVGLGTGPVAGNSGGGSGGGGTTGGTGPATGPGTGTGGTGETGGNGGGSVDAGHGPSHDGSGPGNGNGNQPNSGNGGGNVNGGAGPGTGNGGTNNGNGGETNGNGNIK
jgi:hypothetical protein